MILECDSSNVLDIMKGSEENIQIIQTLVLVIKQLLRRHWLVRFYKIFREANGVADYMAKWAHSIPRGYHFVEQPSVEMLQLLNHDRNEGTKPQMRIV